MVLASTPLRLLTISHPGLYSTKNNTAEGSTSEDKCIDAARSTLVKTNGTYLILLYKRTLPINAHLPISAHAIVILQAIQTRLLIEAYEGQELLK